jgi:hypothetical protein
MIVMSALSQNRLQSRRSKTARLFDHLNAYMVAAGIPEAQPDHALRIAELAIRMLETVNDIAAATGVNLQSKILFDRYQF